MAEALSHLLQDSLSMCRAAGADEADIIAFAHTELSVSVRAGRTEGVEQSEETALGVRVLVGKRQALVSCADLSQSAIQEAAEQAVAMARYAPEDMHNGLPEAVVMPGDIALLALCDSAAPDAAALLHYAGEVEAAALGVAGITSSEGADASSVRTRIALANSRGFAGEYETTRFGGGVSVLAEQNGAKERDYEYATRRFLAELPPAADVGRIAAERTLQRLGGRKVGSRKVPVVFDPRVGKNLLGYLASAISGQSIARGTSFLKDAMGEALFPEAITIMDDPFMPRGLGSHPFDGEGVPGSPLALVENGRLQSWLLDTHTARQLGLRSTGHAVRGLASAPAPGSSNLYLSAGKQTPEALMADIVQGFYVTQTFGMGVNTTTGDYSQGASGFWIEHGKLTYPVHEVTIAGNLREMFAQLQAADDLVFEYRQNVPTLRVSPMMVAGS